MGGNFFLDIFPTELFLGNRPDDAKVVARRHQKDRDGAGHDNRVKNGFMAIAVHNDDITGSNRRIPDDFVRGRRTVSDEEQMVCIKNACGVALRSGDRPSMIEQLPQLFDGVADVGAQHILTEKLVEHLSDRRFKKSHAARVPRTVPGI